MYEKNWAALEKNINLDLQNNIKDENEKDLYRS